VNGQGTISRAKEKKMNSQVPDQPTIGISLWTRANSHKSLLKELDGPCLTRKEIPIDWLHNNSFISFPFLGQD
jgi:hypothetical protein